ncbi:MAG: Cys-Gln thioester bond-forming surface protein [Clostridia bacterium]|nr:Cys-Gln thioester bond-forming surface protein [Clostridia bacterium]
MKIIKRLFIITIILMMFASLGYVKASFKIDSANMYSKGRCEDLFINRNNNAPIVVTKVFYNDGSGEYPAYCLNIELDGVGEVGEYSVSVDEAISDSLVWRVITNGYPYKSLAELGVASEDEAYAATKQALYCILYGFDEDDFWKYEPIGEAGERALNALKQIVYSARNSSSSKVSPDFEIIEKSDLWKIDEIDGNYISKEFSVSALAQIKDYTVNISGDITPGTKLVDIENNEKGSFNSGENFKLLIPINELKKDGSISLKVRGDVATKPVLYGNSNDPGLQNYALTGEIFEIGEGSLEVKYNKNTSKLIIKKQDVDSKAFLPGAEFRVLDSNSNIVYDDVKVDENGIVTIEGILPGNYYLEEIKAPDGYERFERKIEFKVDLNEEVSLVVDNLKKPVETVINKLPKTGM